MAVRKKLLFDYGWRFHRGDIHRPPLMNYMATYHNASAESGRGGAAAAYDDSDWERVDLPHDMVIGVEPEASENEDHGYVRRDNGWYRNYFYLPPEEEGRKLTLLFDGVATECIVWVNGVELRRNFTAGTSFEVDFSDVARYGDEVNVVSVYIDNSTFEGWYYEGGGLYRHVWLLSRDRLGIRTWGLFARPEPMGGGDWQTCIAIDLENDRYEAADARMSLRVLDPKGETAGVSGLDVRIGARESRTVEQRVWLAKPALWSPESPCLYTLQVVIEDASGAVVDEDCVRFGVRKIDFDPDRGMLINGEPVRLRGMCVHQEHGGLGVAIPDGVLEYRVRRLQEMGCNAIRTAHNPPAPQLLDICDRLGMLIMEENRWLNSAPEGMRQLEAMIRRDRNHPCVIMWSMFNEEGAMEFAFGPRIMNAMRARAHQLDGSRPVTYAQNTGLLLPGVARTGDVIGVNYNNDWYPKLHEMYPDMMLYGSETIGYINGRLNEVMDTWHTALKHPYHGGIFAWTGFDYRGEAHWPDVYFRFGAMDPSGCAKDGYHLYQAYWRDDPCIHIATTWKHGAPEGTEQEVRVYTNAACAELFAGGESLGRQEVDPAYQTRWDFRYRAVPLTAVGFDAEGRETCRCTLDNPQVPASLVLRREEQIPLPLANGMDVAIYNAWAVDAAGKVCDRAQGELLEVSLEGPARLLCVGDGDVRDYAPWGSANCRLRRGHCQIILRTERQPGTVVLRVRSENLGSAEAWLTVCEASPVDRVESAENRFISAWRRSPVYEEIKDPRQMLDQNPADWTAFYTSDCEATHAILTDGCVGLCAESAVHADGVGRPAIVFEQNDVDFHLRVEAEGAERFETEVKAGDTRTVTLPEAFVPGTKVTLRVGMSPRQGRDQLTICHNVRWRFEDQ